MKVEYAYLYGKPYSLFFGPMHHGSNRDANPIK